MFSAEWIYESILLLVPLMFSLTVHEFAHARTALAFGDPTAKSMGRVSLNPLVHLDPLGTIVLIVTRGFGWAKPVPVNPNNLYPRRLGNIMVSLAGPASNLCLAIVAVVIMKVLMAILPAGQEATWQGPVFEMLFWLMIANIALCTFNLFPLFPLDGHHILRELLPPAKQADFMHWQIHYGRYILAGMILIPVLLKMPSPVGWVIMHVASFAIRVFDLGQIWSYLP